MRFRIAFRNVFRNKRRSIISITMIGFGVTAIVLFKGFSHQMVFLLRDNLIKNDIGHIQIADKKFWDNSSIAMSEYFLNAPTDLKETLLTNSEVVTISGRISYLGLVSTQERSVGARAIGLNPEIEKGSVNSLNYIEGGPLDSNDKMEIVMGAALAQSLNVHVNDSVTLLTNTIDGVINAIDVVVKGLYQSGIADIDKTTYLLSLKSAQTIIDTDKVEKIVLTIRETENTNEVLADIQKRLSGFPQLQARSWFQISKFYREAEEYYSVYNGVIEVIILTIVLVSILNTVSMSIFERVGEIGTLRALGEQKHKIIVQFTAEGLILGSFGCLFGLILTVISSQILNYLKLPLVIPGASIPLPILIDLVPAIIIKTTLGLVLTTIVAAVVPAVQAAKIEIVEALRRNI